jgi:Putative transposase/Transposase zinc-binding domain
VSLRLADIFRAGASEFLSSRRVPTVVYKAVHAIVSCRTAALGGHGAVCAAGHLSFFYNACRRRACPRCSYSRVKAWLARQSKLLLGCAHHHLIFTVPHELNELWLLNQAVLGDLLFASARSALFKLAADRRYLGAVPGALMALHTWGQQLSLHPHIHCLATAGGVDALGQWIASKRSAFLPAKPLMLLFRGACIDGLLRLLARGQLRLPDGLDARDVERLVRRLWRKRWNVHIRERYGNPVAVLNYLGRYLHGGPLGEGRLVSFDRDSVTFKYKDYRHDRRGVMSLPTQEFIRRYLLHVPPEGFHTVRGYGLYRRGSHNNHLRDDAAKVVPVSPDVAAQLADDPRASWMPEVGKTQCQTCQAPVVLLSELKCRPPWPRSWPPSVAA